MRARLPDLNDLNRSTADLIAVFAALPRLWLSFQLNGTLRAPVDAARLLANEGSAALGAKLLGDALVRTFRDSGPVLIKVGQMLAGRPDLLPPELCLRLEALYAKQPSMPARALRALRTRAWPQGNPLASLEERAFACGSIGQVHRGVAPDGSKVVVKFRRPGVAAAIDRDIAAARSVLNLARRAGLLPSDALAFSLERALEDLRSAFESELDFRAEARNISEFRERFKANPRVAVPRCYEEWSGEEVLVMEELEGEPLSAFRARAARDPAAAKRAASLALTEILKQIFADGRFHADPHAGNLLILPDGRLGLIDLGLTGELSNADRDNIGRAIRAFLARDAEAVFDALLSFGTVPELFDKRAFQAEIRAIVGKHKRSVLGQVGLSAAARASLKEEAPQESGTGGLDAFVGELFQAAHRHQILIPRSATLLVKSLVTIEGVAKSLDPQLNLAAAAGPVVAKALAGRWLKRFFLRD